MFLNPMELNEVEGFANHQGIDLDEFVGVQLGRVRGQGVPKGAPVLRRVHC